MKNYRPTYLLTVIILILNVSCQEKTPDEKAIKETDQSLNLPSSIVLDDLQTNWVSEEKEGKLTKKQIIYMDNKPFINQIIRYKENGEIDTINSNFFVLKIPDTLKLGKNLADIELYTYNKKYDTRYSYVIIENTYSDSKIQLDTFGDIKENFQFGIFAKDPGRMKIKGKIYEEILLEETPINKDSVSIELIKTASFFEKEVFVEN